VWRSWQWLQSSQREFPRADAKLLRIQSKNKCQHSVWSRLHAANDLARSFQNRLTTLWKAPPGEAVSAEALDKLNILSQRNEKMDNPKRFDGANWYASSLLLIGDLVN
jgi:hypothetical protein